MCTRATDSPIGHGVTDFRNFFDFKADVIDEFDVTFIVNRPFESSEARIDVDNDPFFIFLWKNGGKWEGTWGAGVIGGQFLGNGGSVMVM